MLGSVLPLPPQTLVLSGHQVLFPGDALCLYLYSQLAACISFARDPWGPSTLIKNAKNGMPKYVPAVPKGAVQCSDQ